MKKLHFILQGVAITVIYLLYYRSSSIFSIDQLKVLGGFALIQLIYIILSWYRLTGRFVDAYIIFMLACYAFNLSQPIMELFSCVSPARSIITHYNWPIELYCTGTVITMSFIQCFHIGAILATTPHFKDNITLPNIKFELQLNSIKRVAIPLAIISFPFYMYNMAIMMVVSITMGYDAIYDGDIGTNTLFKLLGDFYVPSLICLFFVAQVTKNRIWLITIITFMTVVLPPLIIGGRSNAIIILAILFVIYSFFNKLSVRRVIISVLSIYCLFIIFTAIAGNRGIANRSIGSIIKQDENKENPILFTLSEMGGSMQPLLNCIDILPNRVEYKYGESYLYSLTTIIPNIGFWDVHPATEKANLGNWLKKYLNISYGPGFSIVAEAYYNFGYFGWLFMIFLGWGFTKIYSLVSNYELKKNPIAFIIAVIFLFFTIKLVRNSFEFAIRAICYYCLPMYWLMRHQYHIMIKKVIQKNK